MSVTDAIAAIEKQAQSGNMELLDDVLNLRQILIVDRSASIAPDVLTKQILHLWNAAVRLSQKLGQFGEGDRSVLRRSVIPHLRLLVVDVLRGYGDPDSATLMYCLSHTYKSFLDADDVQKANSLFDAADRLFGRISGSAEATQSVVLLYCWRADHLLADGNGDEALHALQGLLRRYSVESSYLLSFIYDKAVELKSIEWCRFALSVLETSVVLSSEWKEQTLILLAQLLLNNGDAGEALEYIGQLPPSLNSSYLALKCQILLSPVDDNMRKLLFAFIPKTADDRRVLVALCLFVADNGCRLGQVAAEFVDAVLRQRDLDDALMGHVQFSAARIACSINDPSFGSRHFRDIKSADVMTEVAGLFWNQALDSFSLGQLDFAAKWMLCSQALISPTDGETQSCCCRFLSRCFLEQGDLPQALSAAESAIQFNSKSSFSYLMKFRVLVQMNRSNEVFEMVTALLKSNPFLEQFDIEFFTSLAAEVRELGQVRLALDCLMTLIDLRSDLPVLITERSMVSVFALLQLIDDASLRYRCLRTVCAKWNRGCHFDQLTRAAFTAIAYSTGTAYSEQSKWPKAKVCFECGALFGGDHIELIAPCVFQMVKILIKLGSRDDLNLANRTLEDLAPKVEACEQKYRDGFLLSRIKLGIAEGTNPATIRDLIEDVVSGDVLADLVNFLTSADRFVLKAILERAKKLESSDEILSSILHQIVTNAKTKNELRETYEMMIADDALNGRAMSTDQLQFFMAKAWNTGVQLIKARRGKEAEWWLARAIEIMRNDAGLVDLYRDDLEERYAKFLEHENTRIALQF